MTPAERLRKHQRSLEKTQRELDRERTKLENQEKKLIQEIKKSAKNGQMGAAKIQAKDLVRTRRYVEKFYSMRTQLQAISLRIQVCVFFFICSYYLYIFPTNCMLSVVHILFWQGNMENIVEPDMAW